MLLSLYCRLQALKNERGATAVEYGIMVALIAAVIVIAVATLGEQVNAGFEFVSGKLDPVTTQ